MSEEPQVEFLTPDEVGRLFRVGAKTVIVWAREGLLESSVAPSGRHPRRFRKDYIYAILREQGLDGGLLMTPSEVAKLFNVDPRTVNVWAAEGKLASGRTPGGNRRLPEAAVRQFLIEWEARMRRRP